MDDESVGRVHHGLEQRIGPALVLPLPRHHLARGLLGRQTVAVAHGPDEFVGTADMAHEVVQHVFVQHDDTGLLAQQPVDLAVVLVVVADLVEDRGVRPTAMLGEKLP